MSLSQNKGAMIAQGKRCTCRQEDEHHDKEMATAKQIVIQDGHVRFLKYQLMQKVAKGLQQ